ncbi:hypothetical protein [Ponticoccus alexandrii]|uniref:3-ketoacyl-ACP reductase n=1 Tax=Ponticoccus alexandrii TaxID=1943633 RepID=A0ABX7FDI8_9RHOB|nr:hypothetical protein [Ponticoccus alexandrii]ETA50565.1 3-ketoacyl-ACP reductase [Rhodobacteraceae bacterium PD-2]QRF68646.1 3-ketoacyl-ACP reductase [Ponticoccus alexandrii]
MEHQSLHDRLHALGQKIHAAEEKLREQAHHRNVSAHLTAQDLKERYAHLQSRLDNDAAEAEAHGHHVTDLERSFQQWIDSFDVTHVSSN